MLAVLRTEEQHCSQGRCIVTSLSGQHFEATEASPKNRHVRESRWPLTAVTKHALHLSNIRAGVPTAMFPALKCPQLCFPAAQKFHQSKQ